MTAESIIAILTDLNGAKKSKFQTMPVSADVDYAEFSQLPYKTSVPLGKRLYPFYLIKSRDGNYSAAVYVMHEDLHWVVLPKYRNQGILISPLKTAIIPHLLLEREQLVITIDRLSIGEFNTLASERVAEKAGFKKMNEERDVIYYRF